MPTPRDYRIFIGVFPQGELAERLQAVRLKVDPVTARITPPHITLAGTYWRAGSASIENEAVTIQQLDAACRHIAPFKLILGGVRVFPPEERPVIYLGVEKTPGLLAARQALLEVLGPDKHSRYTPHLTLAMRLKADRAGAVIASLTGAAWDHTHSEAHIGAVQLMMRGPQEPAWQMIGRFSLGGSRFTDNLHQSNPHCEI